MDACAHKVGTHQKECKEKRKSTLGAASRDELAGPRTKGKKFGSNQSHPGERSLLSATTLQVVYLKRNSCCKWRVGLRLHKPITDPLPINTMIIVYTSLVFKKYRISWRESRDIMLITLDSDDNLYIPVNNLVSRTIESSKCNRSKVSTRAAICEILYSSLQWLWYPHLRVINILGQFERKSDHRLSWSTLEAFTSM